MKIPQFPIGKSLAVSLVLSFLCLAAVVPIGFGFLGTYILFMAALSWAVTGYAYLQDKRKTDQEIADMHLEIEAMLHSENEH